MEEEWLEYLLLGRGQLLMTLQQEEEEEEEEEEGKSETPACPPPAPAANCPTCPLPTPWADQLPFLKALLPHLVQTSGKI